MIKIGLTGGIACGKSTVANIISGLGIPVLDADQVARNVVAKGTEGLSKIRHHFGSDICLENGELNRPKLRQIIIDDPSKRKRLESITHPLIFKSMLEWQDSQYQKGSNATVVEAALMIETGSYKMYDAIIVAACSAEHQLSRLMARNQVSEETAKLWIESQMPITQKITYGDVVIYNDGTLSDLTSQTISVWKKLIWKLKT